ncbi:MAG TPA: Glu/Leu/Phe/Val dehydrogenase dimerization domain-containing protein [Caulobacteraceae bacterium]|nr:Glu/Leu/Phe/Val dehydrogenase dimerization domain-containing protein [Caulobacteraceae bacterium]
MSVFSHPDFDDHEEVSFLREPEFGLFGIIAVHSTARGPALGGCRMFPYTSEADALKDVLRLSRGMTYKAALMDVPLGGGKSVVIGDPHTDKTRELLLAMGERIERLGGRYIVGEDIGTNPYDMAILGQRTRAVSCRRPEDGGYGDPAPMTALGALQAIKAGMAHARGSDALKGAIVAIQGVGNVGRNLGRLLRQEGAELVICDTHRPNADAAREELQARTVDPEEIYSVEAEVFAPCAVGGTLNMDTIPRLRARVVAGAANNQLADPDCGRALAKRGIVYLPDYVANGGGLISCAAEWYRTDPARIEPDVRAIRSTCEQILAEAVEQGLTTAEAADRIAQNRVAEARTARELLPATLG